MAVPVFLNTVFRYKETLAVVDVQTIIDDLIAELTAFADPWTVTLGGTGVTPSTVLSPVRSDGIRYSINMTRISATRIAYIVLDQNGILVDNATDTRQDIDAGGTTVHYYTGPLHVHVSSERATPETWGCGVLDNSPQSSLVIPRAQYWASGGPRQTGGSLTQRAWDWNWLVLVGATAYALGSQKIRPKCVTSTTYDFITFSGALLFAPAELQSSNIFYGRYFQALLVSNSIALGTELTVPIDTGVTGVFKVVGYDTASNSLMYIALRKA